MIVDAVYDFLCPWCFVGKRHLEVALARSGRSDVEVRWRPFMLYPHFDRGGHDFLAFFREKYGESLRVPMWAQVRAVAEPIGIRFAFESMTRGPASVDGHRLVRWAGARKPGVESALVEGLMSGFYEQARVIDLDFLEGLASGHGLDGPALRAHLLTEDDVEPLFRETEAWRRQGVVSMPHYVIHQPGGGQTVIRNTSVETFLEAFGGPRAD